MKANYYKEYYTLERENWWFMARKEILSNQIEKLLASRTEIKILNVGAALGATTFMLQKFGNVTSLEYDKGCCDLVKEIHDLDFINGSITSLPFQSNEFDLVCAFDVVEHVEEDILAIAELHRVCKPQGYVFTTVPAFMFLWSDHDLINEHVKRYTKKQFLRLFKEENTEIFFVSYFNFFLFPFIAIIRIFSSLKKKIRKVRSIKSDFSKMNNSFLNRLFYKIFRSERRCLNRRFSFPFGVSIMVISIKRENKHIV